jgi:hypothetical protein
MVTITIVDEMLHVEVQGLDKLWALKGSLDIPLAHIRNARYDPEVARGWWHGLRMPGTQLPGVITAGTFYQSGKKVFWDVHKPEKTVVIELQDDRYDELIVEVEDPDDAIRRIQYGLGGRTG